MKRTALIFSALLLQTSLIRAEGPGTSGGEILKMSVGARAVAMGEAYTAMADDASSIYWNPAGLALMQQRQASFMYNQFVQDLTFQQASIGIPLESGAVGGGVSYLGYGDIQGFNSSGNPTGNQKAYSAVGTVGGAWLGGDWSWALGTNLKIIQESLADEKASGYAVDFGGNYVFPQPILDGTIRLGAAITNIGSGVKFIQERDPLPMEWKLGVAAVQMWNKKLNVGLDFVKPRDDKGIIRFGTEIWPLPFIAFRAGYAGNHTEGNGVRAGIGLKIKNVLFDYAYANLGDLGMAHRYELSFKFGEPKPLLSPEERRMYQQARQALKENDFERSVLLFNSLVDLVPKFRPAQRQLKVAMGKMETAEASAIARQGKPYDPNTAGTAKAKQAPELDDLEQMFKSADVHSAQAPTPKNNLEEELPPILNDSPNPDPQADR